ncbi:MAG: hypothetical protein Q8Q09_02705 [Deltaproteobacteria bacterium]|nr:hypothetical protein [Deltaproteobacteria bacterium]
MKSALGPMPIGPSLVGPCPLGAGDARTLVCARHIRLRAQWIRVRKSGVA